MKLDALRRVLRSVFHRPRWPAQPPLDHPGALPRCARLIAAARRIAIDGGRAQVGASEILLALLERELVTATLVRTSVDPHAVREALLRRSPPGAFDVGLGELPFDESASAVLAQALAEAGNRRDAVNPLHLLAGILRVPETPAAQALAECGCSLAGLRAYASGPERGPGTRL